MVIALLPEIILIPSIIALIILVFVTRRKCTRKRKEIYLENFMPPIIDMFIKLGLKEAMLRDFEYRSNTFNKVLLKYIEERKKNDLLKLMNNLRITDYLSTNKFGLALGSLLVEILGNSLTFVEKDDKVYAWYYLIENLEETFKGKPMLEYFYIWLGTKTYAMYTKGPYISAYAFDAYFDVKLEIMVRDIWIKTNNFGIIDKSFGNDGVRFSKYLVIFFTFEVNGYDFRSFLKNEKKAYGSEFELIYVGVNDPETLSCYILEKENDFLAKEEYFLYSFIVLKNLNYKPYFEPKEEVKDNSQLQASLDEKSIIKKENKDEKIEDKIEEKTETKDGKPIAVEANEQVEVNEEVKNEVLNELNEETKLEEKK